MSTDFALLRRLQTQLGTLRQAAVEARRRDGAPPLRGADARQHGRSLAHRVVAAYVADRAEAGEPELSWEDQQDLILGLEARLFGAGDLQQLLDDPEVENINLNGCTEVFVKYADGTKRRHEPVAASNADLVQTVQTLAAHEGLSSRPFDTANPRVNLRLPDGSRLYAVMGVTEVPVISIRRHRPEVNQGLKRLVQLGTCDEELAEFLAAAVRARTNVMTGGATNAGKTTLLRALAGEIDPAERIITVERSLELGLDHDTDAHPDAVAMEERLPNAEGLGAVAMADLVRDSLRMDPDRVIVGEVLGDEVVTMLNAMSQGNDGSLSTIHANSSADVVQRIATYAIQAPERLPWEATVRLVGSALTFVVFIRLVKAADGSQRRFICSVREVVGVDADGQLVSNELWKPTGPGGTAQRHRAVALSAHVDAAMAEAGWRPAEEDGWI